MAPLSGLARSSQRRLGAALRSRVAGDDAAERAKVIWGRVGERWFSPEDPVWRVHADAALFVGGLRALLLQSMHPLAMLAVDEHSAYRDDPWGRLSRTAHFVAATTYGNEAVALAEVSGDERRVAEATMLLAGANIGAGEIDRAAELFEQSHVMFSTGTDSWSRALSSNAKGRAASLRGDLDAAERLMTESMTYFDAAGVEWAKALVNDDIALLVAEPGVEREGLLVSRPDHELHLRDAAPGHPLLAGPHQRSTDPVAAGSARASTSR